MSLSRNTTTSDSESVAENDVSCEESIIENSHNYKPNLRYVLSSNAVANQSRNSIFLSYHNNKDGNVVLPSVSSCAPQPCLESNCMYRTFSYIPQYSNPAPLKQFIPAPDASLKQPEFVSIRYYAPINSPNPKLIKGEAANSKRDSYHLKSANQNVQYSPIDQAVSFHTNYNQNSTLKMHSLFHQYEPSSYRTVNFDASQIHQQNLFTRSNEQRPISNQWNRVGGAGNSSHVNMSGSQKFLSGYLVDNGDYPKNLYSQNQPSNEKSILNKIGLYSGEKEIKKTTKIGAIAITMSALVALVAVSVVLAVVYTRSPFKESQRSMVSYNSNSSFDLSNFNSSIAKFDSNSNIDMNTTWVHNLNSSNQNSTNMTQGISNLINQSTLSPNIIKISVNLSTVENNTDISTNISFLSNEIGKTTLNEEIIGQTETTTSILATLITPASKIPSSSVKLLTSTFETNTSTPTVLSISGSTFASLKEDQTPTIIESELKTNPVPLEKLAATNIPTLSRNSTINSI